MATTGSIPPTEKKERPERELEFPSKRRRLMALFTAQIKSVDMVGTEQNSRVVSVY